MTTVLSRPEHDARASARFGAVTVRLGQDRRVRLALVLAVCALAGWLSARGMPRGPQRPSEVVVAMLGGAVVGLFAGWALRSRWAALVAPVTFAVALEIARAEVSGPSVDRPRLTVTIGVMMFGLGRLFHGLVVFAPMVVGALYGAALARPDRRTGGARRWWRNLRRGVTVVTALALVALRVLLTRPGNTSPIVGADGRPVAGSIAELTRVKLGGHEQTVLIRGRSVAAPVLLYLAGGPGQSDLGYTRAYMPTMENDFVFAVWDQRGTGPSYDALDPTSTWTLDRAVSDTIEPRVHLRRPCKGSCDD